MILSCCSWTTLTQCCPRKWMSDPAGYAVVLTADRGRFATRKLYKSKNTVTGTCEKLLWDLRRSAPDLPDEMGGNMIPEMDPSVGLLFVPGLFFNSKLVAEAGLLPQWSVPR